MVLRMKLQRDDAWLVGILVVGAVAEVAWVSALVQHGGYRLVWSLLWPVLVATSVRANRRNKRARLAALPTLR